MSITERIGGILLLREESYKEAMEKGTIAEAASIAAIAVAVSAFFGFIGLGFYAMRSPVQLFRRLTIAFIPIKFRVPIEIVFWIGWWIAWSLIIGGLSITLGGEHNIKGFMKLTGYSMFPHIFGVARIIPFLGRPIYSLALLWSLACWIYSTKTAFNLRAEKTVMVYVLAFIILIIGGFTIMAVIRLT